MNLRYLWRSVASVLVLSFALFPTLCFASETEINTTTESAIQQTLNTEYPIMPLDVTEDDVANGLVYNQIIMSASSPYAIIGSTSKDNFVSPFDKSYMMKDTAFSDIYQWTSSDARSKFNLYFQIGMADESVLVSAEKSFEITLNGIKHYMRLNYGDSLYKFFDVYYPISKSSMTGIAIEYYGMNGEFITEWLDGSCITQGDGFFGFQGELTAPEFDVKYIQVIFSYDRTGYNFSIPSNYNITGGIFYYTEFFDGVLKIKVQDENTGLLKGIIQWLKSIRDGITNVATSISQLPGKIWTAFENGLKGLFVPSEEDMVAYKDKWDELLSQRFGVVYQSGSIITDTLGTITEQSAQGTINLPATTISFAETDFTFGGYDVPVVPQGFEWLVEIIKGLIDIVVTVAFINAMRTKYDQLMRG